MSGFEEQFKNLINFLPVHFEGYFHAPAFAATIRQSGCKMFESRVVRNNRFILEIFSRKKSARYFLL